jgi:ABC-type transport system involved in multi-copper enzyme maturation permease subunit
MSSKAAIEEQATQSAPSRGFRHLRETAPSVVRGDDPTIARWLGLLGLMLITLGCIALTMTALGHASWIGPIWGSFFSITGLALLLFHAALDREIQVRRSYGLLGYLWLAAAVLVTVLPLRGQSPGAFFLPYGYSALVLGLLFLLPFARNETEISWRRIVIAVFGVVGILLAATGFIGGNISETFLLGGEQSAPYGILLILAGLAYLWAFVGLEGSSSEVGYRGALGIGLAGGVLFLVALGRSVLPPLFFALKWMSTRPEPYFVPTGLLLMTLSLLYIVLGAGLCSDHRLVVLYRRELSAFFYSPIAYLVLLFLALFSCWSFLSFASELVLTARLGAAMPEPVIARYLVDWSPVWCVVFGVPVLTMRLLSEEQRTGTLEVLLTAPVSETGVVLSKFFAVLTFYLLTWIPWGICLIALRIGAGQPFEYRPLLSFYLMVFCTGAGFLAMGLFFSSLTRSQVISAVLTCVCLLVLTRTYFFEASMQRDTGAGTNTLLPILQHISFLNLWIMSGLSEVSPKFFLFPISMAVFWLFLTVKVLESRRWR